MAFYMFFSNLFTPSESFSVLPDDNMCSRDSHPLKSPYKSTLLPFCCWGLLRGCYIHYFSFSWHFRMESHHCHVTPCTVWAIKGQGSLLHSAGLVCKEVNVRGLCNEPDGSEAERVL